MDDIDSKSGLPVLDVLKSKHPEAVIPQPETLEDYDTVPSFTPLDITACTIESVARRMSGGAGPGGVDSMALQGWLLRFGKESIGLREAIASFTCWMANDSPPWAAYRAFMSNRLIALDKCPGVRPVGVGEVWRRLFAKSVIKVAGRQAKSACGTSQLCAGLEAGIEGAVHAVNALWEVHQHDDDWGFLLVDARNAFNEGNRISFLWTIRHRWPAGARFTFNCYRHWAQLLVRSVDGEAGTILFSKEGCTQGDPLAMIVYGIGMLPLVEKLQQEIPGMFQPWYADDAGAAGDYESIATYFNFLMMEGPARGYFPEPTKSILVVQPENVDRAKEALSHLGFSIVTGARYLGGHVGTTAKRDDWVAGKVAGWVTGVDALSRVAQPSPHCAFVGLQKSLQSEWMHLQRVVDDIGSAFQPIEDAILTKFLPALFDTPLAIPPDLRTITSLPVKKAGVGLPNPTSTAPHNHTSSKECTAVLTNALLTGEGWHITDHVNAMHTGRTDARLRNSSAHQLSLDLLAPDMTPFQLRMTERGKKTGGWLSIIPDIVNGMSLSKGAFRDSLRMRYGLELLNMPKKCDGCGAKFSVEHALGCKKGGLVTVRHNEVRDELAYLATLATSSSRVRDEPLIQICHSTRSTGLPGAARTQQSTPAPTPNTVHVDGHWFDRGDLLIHGLYEKQTSCILDVRVTDTDQPSYRSSAPEVVIKRQETVKKKRYLEACLEQRRHFSPFVCDTYGLLGEEAVAVCKRLASMLATKWKSPYSATCGFVNARVSIAIVRATHLCLRGSRVPFRHASTKWSQWDDGAGLGLFRTGP